MAQVLADSKSEDSRVCLDIVLFQVGVRFLKFAMPPTVKLLSRQELLLLLVHASLQGLLALLALPDRVSYTHWWQLYNTVMLYNATQCYVML